MTRTPHNHNNIFILLLLLLLSLLLFYYYYYYYYYNSTCPVFKVELWNNYYVTPMLKPGLSRYKEKILKIYYELSLLVWLLTKPNVILTKVPSNKQIFLSMKANNKTKIVKIAANRTLLEFLVLWLYSPECHLPRSRFLKYNYFNSQIAALKDQLTAIKFLLKPNSAIISDKAIIN